MKTCLLTGFEPFLDHPVNPTQSIVEALDGQRIGGYLVKGLLLPVVFQQAGKRVIEALETVQPDAVISLGLSAGRTAITPERVAINCIDGPEDNEGRKWEDAFIEEDGNAAYFTTLPIRTMVNRLKQAQLPATVSNSAGTYVCNHVMYTVLHYLHQQDMSLPAGFIHVPANHALAIAQPKYAGWSQTDLNQAIRICIESLDG
jgi:pyroglutamyl-peptidase